MSAAEDTGAPNLDAMPRSELVKWAGYAELHVGTTARKMFPSRPKGYIDATGLLISYARAKAAAMALREDGAIAAALRHEDNCDSMYKRLPKFARW